MRTYKGFISELPPNGVFVFGSNTQGRHGKGAALIAKQKFGAVHGFAMGLMNRSYAIITKDLTKKVHPSIPRQFIIDQIKIMYDYASENFYSLYYVAYSGSGSNLNGYWPHEMASMFIEAGRIPDNIIFEESFAKLIQERIPS